MKCLRMSNGTLIQTLQLLMVMKSNYVREQKNNRM